MPGAAVARAVSISPSQYIPAVSISVATGGRGGAGNTGGTVGLTNSGLITTAGDGAIGAMAQSVGGGGGNGARAQGGDEAKERTMREMARVWNDMQARLAEVKGDLERLDGT